MPQIKTRQGISFDSPQVGDNANEYPAAYQSEQNFQLNQIDRLQNQKAGRNVENTFTARQIFQATPHIITTPGGTVSEANSVLTSSQIDTKINALSFNDITDIIHGNNNNELITYWLDKIISDLPDLNDKEILFSLLDTTPGTSENLLYQNIYEKINRIRHGDFNHYVMFRNRDAMIRASMKFIRVNSNNGFDTTPTVDIPYPTLNTGANQFIPRPIYVDTPTQESGMYQNITQPGWYLPDWNSGDYIPAITGLFAPTWIRLGAASPNGNGHRALDFEFDINPEDIVYHDISNNPRTVSRISTRLSSSQIPTPTDQDLDRIQARGVTYPSGEHDGKVVTRLGIYRNSTRGSGGAVSLDYGLNETELTAGNTARLVERAGYYGTPSVFKGKQSYTITHLSNQSDLFPTRSTNTSPFRVFYAVDQNNSLESGQSFSTQAGDGENSTSLNIVNQNQLSGINQNARHHNFYSSDQYNTDAPDGIYGTRQLAVTTCSEKQILFLESYKHDHYVACNRLSIKSTASVKTPAELQPLAYLNKHRVFFGYKVR